MNTQLLLLIFAGIQLFLFYRSYRKVSKSGNKFEFIYPWGFMFGAFVWEDLLVFSLFHFFAAIVACVVHDVRILALSICVFWVVRAAGETMYFFLQQFTVLKVYPHRIGQQLIALKKLFGGISDQKCFIIMQVFHQTLTVVFAILLILLLKNWSVIPSWI